MTAVNQNLANLKSDGSKIRVIQWGLGNVGHHSLRAILERPELELVGLRVYNPAKIGKDAGDFFPGGKKIGVIATDDSNALIALDADVVLYYGFGTTLGDLGPSTEELAHLLESGKNVIASAVDLFHYLKPGLAPKNVKPWMEPRLQEACRKGNTTLYNSGMTPGFALDLWPIFMTKLSRKVDALRITEVVTMWEYKSEMMPIMGFGLPPDYPVKMYGMFEDVHNAPYIAPLHMIADALGAELDDVTVEKDLATHDEDLQAPSGIYKAGTVVAIRFQFIGWVKGTKLVTIECVWRMNEKVAPHFPQGHCRWILEVDGDPNIRASMDLSTEMDAKRPTSLTVAMNCLNALPQVMLAPAGIVNHLTLPLVAGRATTTLNNPQ